MRLRALGTVSAGNLSLFFTTPPSRATSIEYSLIHITRSAIASGYKTCLRADPLHRSPITELWKQALTGSINSVD